MFSAPTRRRRESSPKGISRFSPSRRCPAGATPLAYRLQAGPRPPLGSCYRGPQHKFRRPRREKCRPRPSKWTISEDAWFQSWCTSERGISRPCAAAPVHNPHGFTGLLSRANTVHSSDPACVPGNPAERVCEYAPFRSFHGHSARARPGAGRAARVFDAGLAAIPVQGRVLGVWGAWGTVGFAAHDWEPRPRGS